MNGGGGTTAGWKTSMYVHLLLGGNPGPAAPPFNDLPGWAQIKSSIDGNDN